MLIPGVVSIRRSGAATATQNRVLRHLEGMAFRVPRVFVAGPLEFTSYVAGHVTPVRMLQGLDVDALAEVGSFANALSRAMSSYEPVPGDQWVQRVPSGWSGSRPQHLDLNPGNVLFRRTSPYAAIDFREIGLAQPIWELALLVRHWTPLSSSLAIRAPHLMKERARAIVCGWGGFVEWSDLVRAVGATFDHSLKRRALNPGTAQYAENRRAQTLAQSVLGAAGR